MSEEELHNLFAKMKKEALSPQERTEMREVLRMRINGYVPTYNPNRFVLYFTRFRREFVYVTALVLVFAGAGVSYAASAALPGDSFYKIKIAVIEPLQESLTFSKEGKAAQEARFAERRLSEVASLAVKGKLNTEVRDWLYTQAAERADAFELKLKEAGSSVDTEKAVELASHLEASLDAHANLIEGEMSSSSQSVRKLRESVVTVSRVRSVAEHEINNGSDVQVKAVSKKQLQNAERQYNQARSVLGHAKVLSGNIASGTTLNLDSARAALDEGRKDIEAGSYRKAIPKLLEAGR